MGAFKNLVIDIDDQHENADYGICSGAGALTQLSNLVWRAGRAEGPDLLTPIQETDEDWLKSIEDQLNQARTAIAELRAANDVLKAEAK